MDRRELTPEMAYRLAIDEAKHKHTTQLVRMAMEEGYIRGYRRIVPTPEVSDSWLEAHVQNGVTDPHERERHRKLKLCTARHLHDNGIDLATVENPAQEDGDPPYLFDCFEQDAPYGTADIASPDGKLVVEVGKTNPERVISAFGLVATLIRGIWQDKEVGTRGMVTVPYAKQDVGPELKLFEFRRGPELEGSNC